MDGRVTATVTTDWSTFGDSLAHFRAAAAYLPDLNGRHAAQLKRLRSDRPLTPLALITDLSTANFKSLNGMPEFDQVLLSSELHEVPAVLQRIACRGLLLKAAALIESLDGWPPDLAATLARACRRREPVRTVTKLAIDVLGDDRRTLWKRWCACAAVGTSPHAFIDWLLVAHAVIDWYPGETNRDLASRLGVHLDTLVGAVRRRFGELPLADVAAGGEEGLLTNLKGMLTPPA
jgi:hypothetical protein